MDDAELKAEIRKRIDLEEQVRAEKTVEFMNTPLGWFAGIVQFIMALGFLWMIVDVVQKLAS